MRLWPTLLLAAAASFALPCAASATAVHISGPLTCGNDPCPEGDALLATFTLDFNITGLPRSLDPSGPDPRATDVNVSVLLGDGERITGSGGTADLFSEEVTDLLDGGAGPIGFFIAVPHGWTGNGPVLGSDYYSSSQLDFGEYQYFFFGDVESTTTTVTPEPASLTLLLSGLGSSGLVWRRMRRRGRVI